MAKMFSKASRDGYVMIDHRQSPGTRGGIDANGFVWQDVPAGTLFESKTFTCSRCTAVIIKNPVRDRGRGYCRKCDHDICDSCSLMLKLNHVCSYDTCAHVRQVELGAKTGA